MCILLGLRMRYTFIQARQDSFLSLIKSILVLLCNPFFLLYIVTFMRKDSACSSSLSCCAVSLAWAEGPTAQSIDSSISRLHRVTLAYGKLCLWESPLRNFKANKCCFYKTPYVPAVREIGDVIARTPPYVHFSTDTPTRTRFCFGSWVMCFWREKSRQLKTHTYSTYEEVY